MIKLFCCYNSAFTRKRSDSHKPLCNSQRKLLTWQVIWTLGWNAATLSQTQFASCECHLSAQSHSLQQSACPEKKERNRARCSVTNDGTNDLLSSKCVSTVFKVMVIVMMCMCYFFLNHRLFCCLPVWDLMTHPAPWPTLSHWELDTIKLKHSWGFLVVFKWPTLWWQH